MSKYYWYRTSNVPKLGFSMLSSSHINNRFYIAYHGPLSDVDLSKCNGIKLGRLTKSEFELKHGVSFSEDSKVKQRGKAKKKSRRRVKTQ